MSDQTLNKIPLITLVGQPNSGKTTLFNYLSGKNFKTVNYPGSTVEYSISKILSKHAVNADILDTPGIISLIPSSPDEKLSVDTLYSHPKFGKPDIVAVTVDVSQLSRHLYLVKQLLESNFNIVVVLTMIDVLQKKGFDISENKLSSILNCKVVRVNGKTGKGIDDLLSALKESLNDFEKDSVTEIIIAGKDHKTKLLESYSEIEKIEKEVLFEKDQNYTNGKLDIQKINESIVVLNSSPKFLKADETTLKIDKFILHKFWGVIIFFLIMSLTFTSIFWLAAPLMDLVNDGFSFLSENAFTILGEGLFADLIANGLISGLGSVLVFLPQILILFLILGLLEDSGYLARGAMLIDKPLSKIGLNGKSFVPLLSGFACAIPAMMATRTITNKRERFLTIFIIPLMSCSARLPVYALLIAFLIPQDTPWIGGLALAGIYIFSIMSSIIIAAVVNKFSSRIVKEKDNTSFILELPAYRMPKPMRVIQETIKNGKQYVVKAGPIILYLSLLIWILTTFPNYNPVVQESADVTPEQTEIIKANERMSGSYAAYLGKFIEPVMKPLGLDWRVGVSLIATFAAREVFVSSMALIFKITEDGDDIQNSILNSMREAKIGDSDQKLFTTATTAGLIVFFVFALQCLSTVAIAKKETGSWRIPVLQVVVFTALAYVFAFVTVNGLRAFGVN
ncbi:MAG: ferrous iron transport protein B [Ignavibacteria bacterium]|nr:ferrous iron transport protein B [Ignavibacteria bacterium]